MDEIANGRVLHGIRILIFWSIQLCYEQVCREINTAYAFVRFSKPFTFNLSTLPPASRRKNFFLRREFPRKSHVVPRQRHNSREDEKRAGKTRMKPIPLLRL